MKNILILNAGTRNKLVSYFKQELKGNAMVIATDSYYLAPALYEADQYYVTKRWDEKGYWDQIFDICQQMKIGLIISLIDPELSCLAGMKQELEKRGILVNAGEENIVQSCFDKYRVIQFLEKHGYPTIKTFNSYERAEREIKAGKLSFPLFVKPRFGSGSIGIEKVDNIRYLETICAGKSDVLIQEFMFGQELGVDIYTDLLSDQVISVFAKKKLKMRAGETDKSVSYKNEKLFCMITKFAQEFQLKGTNDIDVFERDGEFYISEINPRFGGGYLHAYECGINFPMFLINNMNGIVNRPDIGNYKENVYMMKYFDVKMLRQG